MRRIRQFQNRRAVWTTLILSSAFTQTSAWSNETASMPAPIESAAHEAPQIDFRFPSPIMMPPGSSVEGQALPIHLPPPGVAFPSAHPEAIGNADAFDSDKARELELAQERELERQRRLEERSNEDLAAGSVAPSISEPTQVVTTPATPPAPAPLEIRPTLIIPPGYRPRQTVSAPTSPGTPMVQRGRFQEPDCEDPSFKVTIKKLVERDQKLILKQARHMEAIRRLRNEDGAHPEPELLSKLPPFESALRTRISRGIPKASIAKRKPKLDRWIYNGRAEEKIAEMKTAGSQIKPRVKSQVESYGKFRKSLDKSQVAETSLKYLESYNAERAEIEHWIESFDRVCKSVTYLKKAQSRGMASVVR